MCLHAAEGPDDALGLQAGRGCRDCFGRLYERYRQSLARYVFEALVRSFDAALEIEDEAWKKAFQHIGSYGGDRPFRAWLLSIARNQALNHLRRLRGAPSPEFLGGAGEPEATPLEALESRESRDRCSRLVRSLPAELREPFYLRAVMDLTNAEVAELLRLPVTTVRGRLFRARKALAERVRESAP